MSSTETSAAHGAASDRVSPDARTSTDWPRILLVYLASVLAAASLGKLSAVGPALAGDLNLSVAQLGWVISAVVAVCAGLGLPAGLWIRQRGGRLAIVLGLGITSVSGGIGALLGSFGPLLGARIVEGVGYLLITTAAPGLIVFLSTSPGRAAALSIWGTFGPVGLGLSTAAGGALGSAIGWRPWVIVTAIVTGLLALAAWRYVPAAPRELTSAQGSSSRLPARCVLLSLAFGLVPLTVVPVIVMLPAFLAERFGQTASVAGALTSVVSLVSAIGGFAAAALLRRDRWMRRLAPAGVLIIAGGWLAFHDGVSLTTSVIGASIVSLTNGIVIAAMLAALPHLVRDLGQVDIAAGLLNQMASAGALLGPPLVGLGVGIIGGWTGAIPVISVGMLISVVLFTMIVPRKTETTPT